MIPSTDNTTTAETPTIAAVVFSYNYAQYLRQAVDSILGQKKSFDQILVIDDGSTDQSREIIESYGAQVEAVYKENSGQLGAAAHVMQFVRTNFVYFLDADDFADADACATIGQHLAGNPVKIQFQLRCVDNDSFLDSVIPAYRRGYNSADMIADNEVIGFYTSPPTSGNVFSVKALRSIPLDQLAPKEPFDGSPMLCMPYLGEVRSVARIIANYRIHGANYSLQHAPSVAMFERSLQQHRLRWQELDALSPGAVHPVPGSTVIELEAKCLMTTLAGDRLSFKMAWAYISRVSDSAMPLRMKFMLCLFMGALTLLPASVGARLVHARRSPGKRNPILKKVLRLLLGVQTTQRI